ncbi:SGNH/GDSL hydrolase family protein [Streptomyces sp. NPDC050504]|uniref:SGNH/GDSL hydrolase family protein n=1 Tax=Streptomyces sp. NPDC050504 TaxID=3365618 RepID=UPI0037B1DB88
MRRSRSNRPQLAAVAAAAATVFAGTAVLSGCDSGGGGLTRGAPPEARGAAAPRAPAWDRSPASLAAVGDSITRGFDACTVLEDCPEVSWATGTDPAVRSLASRLLGANGMTGNVWNFARTGARVAELAQQMGQAAQRKPGLVTVMVGANDACRESTSGMTAVGDFRASFQSALRQLRAASPKTQVYVSSVPDLMRLWSTGRGSALGKQVWKLGICASMLKDADDMGEDAQRRRAMVQERVVAYNKVLSEVCAGYERCRYDGGAVFDYRFGNGQLSHWDWFHPSKDGQGELAAIAHRNVTAARPPA